MHSISMAVVAQANPVQQSWLQVMVGQASFGDLLMLLSAFVIFVGACRLVMAGRRPAVLAAYLMLLPLPVLISIFNQLRGMYASFTVIAATNTVPSSIDYAGGFAVMLFSILLALLATSPTYLVLAYGLLTRTLSLPDEPKSKPLAHRDPVVTSIGPIPATT